MNLQKIFFATNGSALAKVFIDGKSLVEINFDSIF